jgi:hypothetical protein
MSNVHILPDENLGGVLREYVEVERKITVEDFAKGRYVLVDGVYHAIEPTDIVHIDDTRYRLVDRKANEGDKVLVVDGMDSGKITKCEYINDYIIDDGVSRYWHNQYRVLEPVEPADSELVTAEEGDPKSTLDLLANIARRVTELERKFESLESRQKRLMGRIADTEEKLEKILDDIVTLDERTQPLVKPFGEESPFATVATIPTFKYSDLIGKTLKIYGARDGEHATVFGYDESTGNSYVLFSGKEGGERR